MRHALPVTFSSAAQLENGPEQAEFTEDMAESTWGGDMMGEVGHVG